MLKNHILFVQSYEYFGIRDKIVELEVTPEVNGYKSNFYK